MATVFNRGDVLIYKKSGLTMAVKDVIRDRVILEHQGHTYYRTVAQYLRMQNKFIHLRAGERVPLDLVFYCPKTNKTITLSKGSVYLGEL